MFKGLSRFSKSICFKEILNFNRFSCTQISSNDEFKKLVEKTKGLNVVAFRASWCKPCKEIAPKIDEMSKNYPQAKFYSVDVDSNESIAGQYQVDSLPTVHVFIDGHSVKSFIGSGKLEPLEAFIVQNIKDKDTL